MNEVMYYVGPFLVGLAIGGLLPERPISCALGIIGTVLWSFRDVLFQ